MKRNHDTFHSARGGSPRVHPPLPREWRLARDNFSRQTLYQQTDQSRSSRSRIEAKFTAITPLITCNLSSSSGSRPIIATDRSCIKLHKLLCKFRRHGRVCNIADSRSHQRAKPVRMDPLFSPEALSNNTFTDQLLAVGLKGREIQTLAPIFAPLPLNALLLGILTWQVGRYFRAHSHSDSRFTKGLVVSLMLLSMATTAAVCGKPPRCNLRKGFVC